MRLNFLTIAISCALVLIQFKAMAQHFVNGSFEIHNRFFCAAAGNFKNNNIESFFGLTGIRYQCTDTSINFQGTIIRDTTNCPSRDGLNIFPPVHGKLYMAIDNPGFGPSYKQLVFTLSDSLSIGKQYTIRFIAGNYWKGNNFKRYFSLGQGNSWQEQNTILDSVLIDGGIGYKTYLVPFTATNKYNYVFAYVSSVFPPVSGGYDYTSVDNFVLDTCVKASPKKVISCVNFPITLQAPAGGTKYYWNTGDTLSTLTVSKSGLYRSYVYDAVGCVSIDSIELTDKIKSGTTTQINFCKATEDDIQFEANPAQTYQWNTGATNSSILVSAPGKYWVMRQSDSCFTVDSFNVIGIDTLVFNVKDTSFCRGNVIQLQAPVSNQYTWNNGDTTPFITTNSQGLYWVKTLQSNCTTQIDSFTVTQIPTPNITKQDSFVCANNSLVLIASPAQNYVWNTGEKTSQISIKQSGTYWAITNNAQCTGSDSFAIVENPLPIITGLSDTTVCFDQIAQILLDAGQFKSYLWKPTGETTRTIYSNAAQVYLLTVTDSNNCSMSKQVAVMETCPEFVFIPNAFTPYGDGVNDVFQVSTRSLESFELSIYNRWGQLVFESMDATKSWDGSEAPSDAYVYLVTYKVTGKPLQTTKGTVSLVR